jgi:predicted nucleic acid-binding protein
VTVTPRPGALSMCTVPLHVAQRLLTDGLDRVGAYDLLIAGQALRRELTVVTANTSEFSRVTGLSWQDWTT